jgi:hypothetical protein
MFFSFLPIPLLRGTHTPSFAHSAPMRVTEFFPFGTRVGKDVEGPLEGPLFLLISLRFSFSYISLRDLGF